MSLFAFIIFNFIAIANAGCPFAAMMNSYNFSGDWSYNLSADTTVAYVMHMCHFANNEVYFSIAKNNTPDSLIGFGAGNWSQQNMMIGGSAYEINNGTSYAHGFGVGMNMEVHKWWIQDPLRSQPLDEGKKGLATAQIKQCIIPYGGDIRNEYFEHFWDAKRKFHRLQRIEKRKRERTRKKKLRAYKKKPTYLKYYGKFLDFIGFGEEETDYSESDAILSAKFAYETQPIFPTLFGSTWTDGNGMSVTFVNEKQGCLNGEMFTNVSVAYYGVGMNTFTDKDNGIRNGQFFVQTGENELIGSQIVFRMDENGEIIEDEIKGFTMEKADTFLSCLQDGSDVESDGKGEECDTVNGGKCEL